MARTTYHHSADAYSAWHRTDSLTRFVDEKTALLLAMIDVDVPLYVEYRDGSRMPICLIETAVYKGRYDKVAAVTRNLAEMAKLPAYTVLYELALSDYNPADPKWLDIDRFHMKRLWPQPETKYRVLDPDEYISALTDIRNLRTPDEVVARIESARESAPAPIEYVFDYTPLGNENILQRGRDDGVVFEFSIFDVPKEDRERVKKMLIAAGEPVPDGYVPTQDDDPFTTAAAPSAHEPGPA